MSRLMTTFALVITSLFIAQSALADGFVGFECIEVGLSSFELEVVGTGASCAVVNRRRVARNRAIRSLEANASFECEAIGDGNPAFWGAYCQAICEFNGYDDSQGIDYCSYEVTQVDTWDTAGCAIGRRQFNRQEADVQCGCNCTMDL